MRNTEAIPGNAFNSRPFSPQFQSLLHSSKLAVRNHLLLARGAFSVPSDAHGSHQTPGLRKRLTPELIKGLFASRTPRKDSGFRGFSLRVSAQPGPLSLGRAGRRPQAARSPGGRHADSPLALGPRRRPRPRRLAPPDSSRRKPPPRRSSGRASPLSTLLTHLDRDTNDTPATSQSGGKPVGSSLALG